MNNYFQRRTLIILQIFIGLIRAWMIKRKRNMSHVSLPEIDNSTQLSDDEISFTIMCTDLFVKFGTFRTGRKCFFRTYIIAIVFRKWSIPVMINVGLCNKKMTDHTIGHCWLTINDKPFAEIKSPNQIYSSKLYCSDKGVCYWYGIQ